MSAESVHTYVRLASSLNNIIITYRLSLLNLYIVHGAPTEFGVNSKSIWSTLVFVSAGLDSDISLTL